MLTMRSETLLRCFPRLIALILWATSIAKLVSAAGTEGILYIQDPVIPVTNKLLLFSVGGVEVFLAAYLWLSQRLLPKYLGINLLATCFLAYRLGTHLAGVKQYCPCLGTVGGHLPFTPSIQQAGLLAIALLMFTGSALGLWWILAASDATRRTFSSRRTAPTLVNPKNAL